MLQPLSIPQAPFIDISMDFIERLSKFDGNEVILVVVDKFRKYTHFMTLMHPYSTAIIAKTSMGYVYKLHGLPITIVSDRDPVFLSHF